MASYNETVLYSSLGGTNTNFSLSSPPSAYDSIRVCYGSPSIGANSNSLNNLGAMWTVTYPTAGHNYVNLYNMFFGGVNTTTCNTPYRTCAAYSACSSQNWKIVFNRYGTTNSNNTTINAPWTHVYSVIGITTGSQGHFHKDLLYDVYRDGQSTTVQLTAHPSGYKRIGIVAGALGTAFGSQSMDIYQEYNYANLAYGPRSGNIMILSKYSDSPTAIQRNLVMVGMYGGCSGQTWTHRYGKAMIETGGNPFDNQTAYAVVKQVIGIDRI